MGGALIFVPELRSRARTLLVPIALAYGLAAIPLAPYLWYAKASVPPALASGVGGTSVDLLSYFFPRTGTLFGGSLFAPLTQAFNSNVSEDGAYLTPSLLIALACILFLSRNDRVTRLLFAFVGVAFVLSLGASLQIRGHRTLPLPWWIFERVPVLKDALPERFTMYLWLGIAVIVARWLSALPPPREWQSALRGRPSRPPGCCCSRTCSCPTCTSRSCPAVLRRRDLPAVPPAGRDHLDPALAGG